MSNGTSSFRYVGRNGAMKDIINLPAVAVLCGSSAKSIHSEMMSASKPVGDTPCEYYLQPYKSQLGNTCYIVGTRNWAAMRRNGKDNTVLKGLKRARG